MIRNPKLTVSLRTVRPPAFSLHLPHHPLFAENLSRLEIRQCCQPDSGDLVHEDLLVKPITPCGLSAALTHHIDASAFRACETFVGPDVPLHAAYDRPHHKGQVLKKELAP